MYRFVGANPSFTPDFDTPHNVGGTPASPWMEKVFTAAPSSPWGPFSGPWRRTAACEIFPLPAYRFGRRPITEDVPFGS